MGKGRPATLVIIAGGIGLLVGSMLRAKFPSSDSFDPDAAIPPIWYDDSDLRATLGLTVLLLGLAVWHLLRFGIGKLVVIGLLGAGALLFSLADFGTGEWVWSRDDHAGDELVGIWLFIASATIVVVGTLWSSYAERPAGSKTLWAYVFGSGPGGSDVRSAHEGIEVAAGSRPPDGWWLASDGRWYPPEARAETPRSGAGSGS